MVNLFSSRSKKRDSYQGFSKYNEEINRYQNNTVAGLPNSSITRSQSLSNGAGQAALAALRMHSPQLQQQNQQNQHLQPPSVRSPSKRTNSLTSNSVNRSNSLRSYTYNPKPSYVTGPQAANPRRYNSLTSSSAISYQLAKKGAAHANKTARSPLNPGYSYRRPSVDGINESEIADGNEEEENTIITTKTTRVVDSLGRTQSITTQTVKTLPDGSNIIETTTKNISRSNSRANSITSATARHNSLLSNSNPINLQKIEEDLQNFDYNYLDHPGNHDLKLDMAERAPINKENQHLLGSPFEEFQNDVRNEGLRPEVRSNSLTAGPPPPHSNSSSPTKPLRSILKNSQKPTFSEDGQLQPPEQPESLPQPESPKHPYSDLTNSPKSLSQPPKVSAPVSPPQSTAKNAQRQFSPRATNPNNLNPTATTSNADDASVTSPGNSIKFLEQVETIPIYNDKPRVKHVQHQDPHYGKHHSQSAQGQQSHKPDADFYAAAMEAAYKRVYGDRAIPEHSKNEGSNQAHSPRLAQSPLQQPTSGAHIPNDAGLDSLIKNGTKRDKKSEENEGIQDNYKYENHHREFIGHSMRDSIGAKGTTRKERAKEEKKRQKEQEAAEEAARKEAEKAAKQQEKLAKQEQKVAAKEQKSNKSPRSRFSLFRRKRSDSVDSNNGVHSSGAALGGAVLAGAAISAPIAAVSVPSFNGQGVPTDHSAQQNVHVSPVSRKQPPPENVQSPQDISQPQLRQPEPTSGYQKSTALQESPNETSSNAPQTSAPVISEAPPVVSEAPQIHVQGPQHDGFVQDAPQAPASEVSQFEYPTVREAVRPDAAIEIPREAPSKIPEAVGPEVRLGKALFSTIQIPQSPVDRTEESIEIANTSLDEHESRQKVGLPPIVSGAPAFVPRHVVEDEDEDEDDELPPPRVADVNTSGENINEIHDPTSYEKEEVKHSPSQHRYEESSPIVVPKEAEAYLADGVNFPVDSPQQITSAENKLESKESAPRKELTDDFSEVIQGTAVNNNTAKDSSHLHDEVDVPGIDTSENAPATNGPKLSNDGEEAGPIPVPRLNDLDPEDEPTEDEDKDLDLVNGYYDADENVDHGFPTPNNTPIEPVAEEKTKNSIPDVGDEMILPSKADDIPEVSASAPDSQDFHAVNSPAEPEISEAERLQNLKQIVQQNLVSGSSTPDDDYGEVFRDFDSKGTPVYEKEINHEDAFVPLVIHDNTLAPVAIKHENTFVPAPNERGTSAIPVTNEQEITHPQEAVSSQAFSTRDPPREDKSSVPTIASQRSDQPTNSTVATESHHNNVASNENTITEQPSEPADDLIVNKKKSKKKSKSKFKEKIFKYFINNYQG
ncbi:uncharacterized protein RJT20DRAFT_126459 [Scheffersomyces xylosifermentans]|uniref:uncharacterized protein n=1 Tax=Scheffersomyces xylosifermentans TaxID=1304137 RepID=UPI00315CF169